MSRKLSQNITIPCYATDEHNVLTVSAFMDYAQEIAGRHADKFGFGHDQLIKEGLVWIISRMHIHFDDTPEWTDEVRLTTWHKGCTDRLFYRREFVMENVSGDHRNITATSGWLLFNLKERKLVRSSELCDREETICTEDAVDSPCERLRIPAGTEMVFTGRHEVTRSEIDRNGHVNNAKYASWALDCLPDYAFDGKTVRDFSINFNHETLKGDTVDIFRAGMSSGKWMVEGKVGQNSAFVSEILFETI